jgi:hypothetical protein
VRNGHVVSIIANEHGEEKMKSKNTEAHIKMNDGKIELLQGTHEQDPNQLDHLGSGHD